MRDFKLVKYKTASSYDFNSERELDMFDKKH